MPVKAREFGAMVKSDTAHVVDPEQIAVPMGSLDL
jgi:hypothetical protein